MCWKYVRYWPLHYICVSNYQYWETSPPPAPSPGQIFATQKENLSFVCLIYIISQELIIKLLFRGPQQINICDWGYLAHQNKSRWRWRWRWRWCLQPSSLCLAGLWLRAGSERAGPAGLEWSGVEYCLQSVLRGERGEVTSALSHTQSGTPWGCKWGKWGKWGRWGRWWRWRRVFESVLSVLGCCCYSVITMLCLLFTWGLRVTNRSRWLRLLLSNSAQPSSRHNNYWKWSQPATCQHLPHIIVESAVRAAITESLGSQFQNCK